MPETQTLNERVIDQALEFSRDHRPLFADLGTRLEPQATALAAATLQAFDAASVYLPVSIDHLKTEHEQAVRLVVECLKTGDLSRLYSLIAAYARKGAESGVTFDRALALTSELERCALPFLRRAFPAGPELKLAFSAVDTFHAGVIALLGAVYVEFAQHQLVHGSRMRVLGQLSSGAAHSLNNLFTAIMGHTQLLLDHTRQREAREELQEIQRVATQGAQMVWRLQEMSRPDAEEEMTETDVNNVVREAAEITRFIWRDQAEANGIVVDVVKDLGQVPGVMARPQELREALIALILNAIDAMPNGGMVTLRTERKGENVLISVTDTGSGIPKAIRAHIMEPFFTTRGVQHAGLGLSSASSIAARHNGELVVESGVGRGSNMTLSLPIAAAAKERPDEAAQAQEVTVLIIDDEPSVRDIVTRFLGYRGYPVVVADSGPEGIALFKERRFDLVMTDLGMPGMSGWEVAKELKRLRPEVPVVLMTGWATEMDAQKAKENGIDRVVHKPFNVDEILSLLREAATLQDKI